MKAITICQPYAHLFCLPVSDPWHKRVENRTWSTEYRGLIAIHAGASRSWLGPGDEQRWPNMVYSAIVAVGRLHSVLTPREIQNLRDSSCLAWLKTHGHVEGPYCWAIPGVVPLAKPIPIAGKQKLWDVPAEHEKTLLEAWTNHLAARKAESDAQRSHP